MGDQIATVLAILAVFVALPVALLWAKDRITRARRDSPRARAARAAERQAYEQRILQPDWALAERYLQRSIPVALRDLYADRSLITARDLDYSIHHSISTFEALDAPAFAQAKKWLGVDGVVFATSDMGDSIYLRTGPSQENAVYLTRHDGGDTEVIAQSIDDMVETLRQSKTNPV